MGTFANSFYAKGAHIPPEKKQEFQERLEMLFQAGGMMEIERISMFGIEANTLRKARMHERGMNFYYSYFEEDSWENAGYNLEDNYVWSNKIGWREFNWTVIAAYVLESLYTDGAGAVFENGELINEAFCTGWINYLFHEDFRVKNHNPWKLFDAISTQTDKNDYKRDIDWEGFTSGLDGMIGYVEIYAVQNGIDNMMQWLTELLKEAGISLQDDKHKVNFFSIVRLNVKYVRAYRADSDLPVDEQLQVICDHIKAFYQNSDMIFSDFTKKYDLNPAEEGLFLGMFLMNLPVITIKAISEMYEKDFWELWGEFRDVVYESNRSFPMQPAEPAAPPVSTVKFFGHSADDMIYFWQEDGDILFSDELKGWFSSLKKRYDEIMNESFSVENPIKWFLELMNYAQEEYYHIFTFTEFLEESIAHQSEQTYIALWKLYDEMLHDPEMEKAGSVIFVPEGPEHEREGLHYISSREPRRRLLREWCITAREKRENTARVTLRRYMALVANVDLRKKVFGF